MAGPTLLPTSERFFAPEISKVYITPAVVATTGIPTRTEIEAGHDITDEIADLSGWLQTSGSIATPDLGHRFIGSIPGRKTISDSSITFYASLDGKDIREVLTEGMNVHVVFADGGDVVAFPADCYPARVASIGKVRSTGENAFQLTITFTITRPPVVDFPLPEIV
jgi:hypothetical protein